jgi:hypothetical protein
MESDIPSDLNFRQSFPRKGFTAPLDFRRAVDKVSSPDSEVHRSVHML